MRKIIWILFLTGTFIPLTSPAQNTPVSSRERVHAARAAKENLSAWADSLARLVDSLRIRVDSISRAMAEVPKVAEPAQAQAKKTADHWKGGSGLGLTLNRGNSDQTTLVTTLELERKGERTRYKSLNSVTSTSGGQGGKTDKGAFKNKFELRMSEQFFYFAALDADFNRQAGIDLRLAPGLGAGIMVINRKKCRLNFNLGANPITEFLRGRSSSTNGYYLDSEDLSLELNSRTRLEQSINWKLRFDQTEDYLLTFGLALANKLTEDFDLKLNLESRYDSRPPARVPPVKRQDWMFYTSAAYNLW